MEIPSMPTPGMNSQFTRMKAEKTVEGSLIGRTAQRLLAERACRGVVLAVVTGATYLRCDDGEILWIVDHSACMHNRSLRVMGTIPAPVPGIAFQTQNAKLEFASGEMLDLNSFQTWQPPTFDDRAAHSIADIHPSTVSLIEMIARQYSPSGLGVFIVDLAEGIFHSHSDKTLSAVRPLLERIHKAVAIHDMVGILTASKGLVGLGNGLTPSGDDFLGGLLFCLHYLEILSPLLFKYDLSAINDLLARAKGRTNEISFTMLADLAHGLGIEPLHHVLFSLMAGKPFAAFEQHLSSLVRFGHSTGWDMLTGILMGLFWFKGPES